MLEASLLEAPVHCQMQITANNWRALVLDAGRACCGLAELVHHIA